MVKIEFYHFFDRFFTIFNKNEKISNVLIYHFFRLKMFFMIIKHGFKRLLICFDHRMSLFYFFCKNFIFSKIYLFCKALISARVKAHDLVLVSFFSLESELKNVSRIIKKAFTLQKLERLQKWYIGKIARV